MARNGAYYRYLLYRRRRRNGAGFPRWAIALGLLGGFFAIVLGVLAAVGYGVYRSYADDLIPPDEAIRQLPRGGARILDRNGKLLYEYVGTAGRYEPVPIDEVSWYLINATVATEDADYWSNPGVNYKGLGRAAWENFSPFDDTPGFLEGTGGSSITQQLVKNIYFPPEERSKRSLQRKLRETVYALELTRKYQGTAGKRQILEWYLNQISYGGIYTGIEAASQGYFQKRARDLTLAEAATLAGIPSCPSCYDPISNHDAAVHQRNKVLVRMMDERMISPAETWAAATEPLVVNQRPIPVAAPHFVFTYVQPELERRFGEEAVKRDGLVVYTSLDLDVQRRAEEILSEQIGKYEYSGAHNGAFVAIDPKTAEILAMVGSRDYFREDIQGQNNNAIAENSPGSAFKPFTYVTTFMNLGWGPGTMILDTPLPSEFWDGKNPPRNPRGDFKGPITVRNALGNSLNVPAVKAILYVGVDNVVKQAKKMGITTLEGKQLGPSMTVGGVDVSLVDMVYGYSVFPNLGVLKGVTTTLNLPEGNRALDPAAILRVEDRDGKVLYPLQDGQPVVDRPFIQEERVVPEQEAFLINDILSDGNARCFTFGCGGLSIDRPMAIKTGTSEPFETGRAIGDTWALAYTEDVVAGSWAGNSDNTPMTNIAATSIPQQTVLTFMREYVKDKPKKPFTRPERLVRTSVCIPSGLKPTRDCPRKTPDDWLAAHAEPQRDDTWWRVDRGRRFLELPPDLPPFHRNQAQEWARLIGSTVDTAREGAQEEAAVAITGPADGATVAGVVPVTGRARSPGFQSYRLEYQAEFAPGSWTLIANSANPVADGELAVWDAGPLVPGRYILRLVVLDRERGELTAQVTVQVQPPAPPPPAPPPPDAAPPQPPPADQPQGRLPGRGRSR